MMPGVATNTWYQLGEKASAKEDGTEEPKNLRTETN